MKKKHYHKWLYQNCGGTDPIKKTDGAAAYDVFASENTIIKPGRNAVPLGFRQAFDKSIEALIEPRSGFSLKGFAGYETGDLKFENEKRFDADVIVGKLDSDYRGIPCAIVKSFEDRPFICKAGTAIAQMTFVRIVHPKRICTDNLPVSTRDNGGFGHTGH